MSASARTKAALAKHGDTTNPCGCRTWWRGEGKAARFYLKPCKPSCAAPNPEIERATAECGVTSVRVVYDGGALGTVRGFRRIR